MTDLNYAAAGVNIEAGDLASKYAYTNAKTTFSCRDGLIGKPFNLEGGFAGVLDMGNFLLLQNDDGVGTKAEIAERTSDYTTLGEDLLCMVVDDAICLGAESISVTNTFDVPKVLPEQINELTASLARAAKAERVVLPGGEVAELGNAVNKLVWNATAVGVVKKEKFITGQNIEPGQVIIGLQGRVLRSNGTSLARKICEATHGENWHEAEWKDGKTWGKVLLTPSKIFHRLLLDTVVGDFESPLKYNIHGIVHITGGGIPGNVPRILPKGLGANLTTPHAPHAAIKDLARLGNIADDECYRTWHCGSAMMLIVDEAEASSVCDALNLKDPEVDAKIIGTITNQPMIQLASQFSDTELSFPL